MRIYEMQRLLHEQPFRPFRIHMSNGRSHEVRHPEMVVVGRDTAFIGKPAPDLPPGAYDDFAIVSLLHINEVEPLPVHAPPDGNGAS